MGTGLCFVVNYRRGLEFPLVHFRPQMPEYVVFFIIPVFDPLFGILIGNSICYAHKTHLY